jgi:hypothetical protein
MLRAHYLKHWRHLLHDAKYRKLHTWINQYHQETFDTTTFFPSQETNDKGGEVRMWTTVTVTANWAQQKETWEVSKQKYWDSTTSIRFLLQHQHLR